MIDKGIERMIILDPDGKEYEVDNQLCFAKEHGLRVSCLNQVINRKRYHHKGWHLPDVDIYVRFISPTGERYKVRNIAQFAREMGLKEQGFYRLARRQICEYLGWKCDTPT